MAPGISSPFKIYVSPLHSCKFVDVELLPIISIFWEKKDAIKGGNPYLSFINYHFAAANIRCG